MQEKQLYALWQALGRSGQWVRDARHRLRVLDAGALNLSFGPDFTGACFELDGTRFYGDVEMHVKQSDWYRHRHHLDPFYKNVALHVVLTPPEDPAQVLSRVNQRFIPSFFLNAQMLPSPVQHPALHCQPASESPDIPAILEHLALRRFKLKIRAFYRQLSSVSLEQLFYASLLRALGYPNNAAAFELLAQRLPVAWLKRQLNSPFFGFEQLYALYAGQAGFLTMPRPDPYSRQLQLFYEEHRFELPTESLFPEQWQFAGVRAVNHPHFRLAAWVALLQKAQDLPFSQIYHLFARRLPFPQLLQEVLLYFKIPVSDYWARHYRLASAPVVHGSKFYFGRARIFEILTNVVLPLLTVRALRSHSEGFLAYLQNFYLWLPPVTTYRSLTRYFPWWKGYQALWPRHAFWQALLQLNSEFCHAGACEQCPLQRLLDKSRYFD